MMSRATMLVCLVLGCAIVAEASILKEKRISPSLRPESSAKFEKDYAGDKRPKVDVLHFNHPYPVVQDSEDFDADFVKDENKDNGEWKAQSEYDRLRHKLANLKKEAAEALAKKEQEKKELEAAMQKKDATLAKDKADITKKNSEVIPKPQKPEQPSKPVKPLKPVPTTDAPKELPAKLEPKEEKKKPEEKKEEPQAESWSWWPFSWPTWSWGDSKEEQKEPTITTTEKPQEKTTKKPTATTAAPTTAAPKPKAATVDTSDEEKAVEQAIEHLKNCKDELAEAKAELKKMMEELEQAKKDQVPVAEKLKKAEDKQADAEKHTDTSHSKYKAELKQSAAAEAAFLKQQEKTMKLKRDLVAAAAKVTAMRQAEDASGGVYPTPTESHKSSASALSSMGLIVAILAFA